MDTQFSTVWTRVFAVFLAVTLLAVVPSSAHAERVKPEFFGMDLISLPKPSGPLVSTPTMRLIISWNSVETSPGQYDWSDVDARMQMAQSYGSRPLLTLVNTPSFWATGDPRAPDFIRPPKLSAYGAFVQALTRRYGSRADYQPWGEMNCPCNYIGSPRHMAKMVWIAAQQVRRHAPAAVVVAPQGPLRHRYNRNWFRKFWGQRVGGKPVAAWVDVASLSGFPLARQGPELAIKLVQWLRRMTEENGFAGPIWIVEVNYDVNGKRATVPISIDQQVANVVKTYTLNASIGTGRVYWHYWSAPAANMNTAMLTSDNQVAPPGRAFGVIQPWLVGTRAEGCTITNKDLYICLFTTRRTERRVVWSMSGMSQRILAPDRARKVFSADGTVRRIDSSEHVHVDLVPVMIESRRESGPGRNAD